MPLETYTFIHRNALFTEAKKKEIIEYLLELQNSL